MKKDTIILIFLASSISSVVQANWIQDAKNMINNTSAWFQNRCLRKKKTQDMQVGTDLTEQDIVDLEKQALEALDLEKELNCKNDEFGQKRETLKDLNSENKRFREDLDQQRIIEYKQCNDREELKHREHTLERRIKALEDFIRTEQEFAQSLVPEKRLDQLEDFTDEISRQLEKEKIVTSERRKREKEVTEAELNRVMETQKEIMERVQALEYLENSQNTSEDVCENSSEEVLHRREEISILDKKREELEKTLNDLQREEELARETSSKLQKRIGELLAQAESIGLNPWLKL